MDQKGHQKVCTSSYFPRYKARKGPTRAHKNVRNVRRNRGNIVYASRSDHIRPSRAFRKDFRWPAGSSLDSFCGFSGPQDKCSKSGFCLVTSSLFGTHGYLKIDPNLPRMHHPSTSRQVVSSSGSLGVEFCGLRVFSTSLGHHFRFPGASRRRPGALYLPRPMHYNTRLVGRRTRFAARRVLQRESRNIVL